MDPNLPIYIEYLFPTLEVLAHRQGSARIDEVHRDVIGLMHLTQEQAELMYPPTARAKGSKVLHRIRFSLTWLKMLDAVDNSQRGVWTLTPVGRRYLELGDAALREAYADMKKRSKPTGPKKPIPPPAASSQSTSNQPEEEDELDEAVRGGGTLDWKNALLSLLQSLSPSAFERLCARVLREAGCSDVHVTGRSGDGGLDGVAVLHVSLLSFPIYFQAKRYVATNSIGPDKVRELRGALAGRGDKGILITTSFFTSAAADEARRAGAPIDLVDGDQLCDLLLEYGLGVERRPVVLPDFFDSL